MRKFAWIGDTLVILIIALTVSDVEFVKALAITAILSPLFSLFKWAVRKWLLRYRPFKAKLTLTYPFSGTAIESKEPRLGVMIYEPLRPFNLCKVELVTKKSRLKTEAMRDFQKFPLAVKEGETTESLHFGRLDFKPFEKAKLYITIDGFANGPIKFRVKLPPPIWHNWVK